MLVGIVASLIVTYALSIVLKAISLHRDSNCEEVLFHLFDCRVEAVFEKNMSFEGSSWHSKCEALFHKSIPDVFREITNKDFCIGLHILSLKIYAYKTAFVIL